VVAGWGETSGHSACARRDCYPDPDERRKFSAPDPALLRQVFAVAVGSPAQIISLQKMQGQLQDSGALETVAHYLALLQDAYLIASLEKYAAQAHRRRSAPPKLVTLNNGLLSAMHPDSAPDREREPARFGQWVENACLALAFNQGQQVTYWREEPLEIDGVFEGSWGNWAVEVKTGRFGGQDIRRLLEFCRRYLALTPLLIATKETKDGAEIRPRRHQLGGLSICLSSEKRIVLRPTSSFVEYGRG